MQKFLPYSFLFLALLFSVSLYSQDSLRAKMVEKVNLSGSSGEISPNPKGEVEISTYPNPFNSQVNLEFRLEKDSKVILEIYNILGRKVKTVHNSILEEGEYSFRWDGSSFDNGIYLYKFNVNGEVQTGRLILRK